MNKSILGIKKSVANILASVIFWDKKTRDAFRDKISPINKKRCVKYLGRYAKGVKPAEQLTVNDKYVWACWLQGEENAPEIVKKCFESVRKYKPVGYELVIIDYNNLDKYVSLPDFVLEKHRRGIISHPHFSDIVRLCLLRQYGGFWIDATCLLTSVIPEKIYQPDFFIYRSFGKFERTFINNCFIYSKANNQIVSKWLGAIFDYWKNEDFPIEYFVHHYLFIALLENDAEFNNLYNSYLLTETDENMHLLFRKAENNEEISEEFYKKACELSFIHKLTYKFEFKLPL